MIEPFYYWLLTKNRAVHELFPVLLPLPFVVAMASAILIWRIFWG